MELKDKIEQRRREREAEAVAAKQQQRLADAQSELDAQAEKERITKEALSVLSDSGANDTSGQLAALSKEEAEKILDKAANEAVSPLVALAILCGLGFGIYIGFTASWGGGTLLIIGTLVGGSLLHSHFASEKKSELQYAHRMEQRAAHISANRKSSEKKEPE